MKKLILTSILSILIFTGCTSLTVQRSIKDNTLYSSYPKIEIQISSEFQYLGDLDKFTAGQSHRDPSITTSVDDDNYIFIIPYKNSRIVKRLIHIKIRKLPKRWHFISNYYGGRAETQSIDGHDFIYVMGEVNPGLGSEVVRYCYEKNYSLSRGIAKYHAKKLTERMLIEINYYENLDKTEVASSSWIDDGPPSDKQKEFIIQFEKNFKSSIKILKL